MYKTILITIILLLLVTFGLSGCAVSTARTQDTQMGGHGHDTEEVVTNLSYNPSIDIDWPF